MSAVGGPAHNVNCIDFARWKVENEENQQKGLAAFLKEIGIGELNIEQIHITLLY